MDYTGGYKIGDRVICTEDATNYFKVFKTKGKTGTVVHFYKQSEPHIGVKFDEYVGGHTCFFHCKDGYGFYMYPNQIKLIDDVKQNKDEDAMVTISKEEYERLQRDSEMLSCLEACGVDNWQGYGDAVDMMEEDI